MKKFFSEQKRCLRQLWAVSFPLFLVRPLAAAETNLPALSPSSLPQVGPSIFRVLGAFALVIAIFLGAVWLLKNWQRLMVQRSRAPKLNVLEVRSLGSRQSLYVVAYEQERFLLASSPNGVNLITQLPPSDGEKTGDELAAARPTFAQALSEVLKKK
jgi:flagellar biosynthetic protein FliO